MSSPLQRGELSCSVHAAVDTPGSRTVWTLDNMLLRMVIQKAKTTEHLQRLPSLGFKLILITTFQNDSMVKFVTDICYLGSRTSFSQKLKTTRNGLEVSFKIGIEWQLVEVFISASVDFTMWSASRSCFTEIQLRRKAFQKEWVHICDDMGNVNVLAWLKAVSYQSGKAAQIQRLTQTK